MASLTAFVSINIVGFVTNYSFKLEMSRGPVSITWVALTSILQQGAILVAYLIIFDLFLMPFLVRRVRRALLFPSVLALIYAYLVIQNELNIFVHFIRRIASPGLTFPPLAQLYSPFFGIPGTLLSNGIYNTAPANALWFASASNTSYAVLCFLTALLRKGM